MKLAMQKHKLTVSGLARRIGASRPYVSDILHGKKTPSAEFASKIHHLLKLSSVVRDESFGLQYDVNSQQPASPYGALSEADLLDCISKYHKELQSSEGPARLIALNVLIELLSVLKSRG